VSDDFVARVKKRMTDAAQPQEKAVEHNGKVDSKDGKKRPGGRSAAEKQQAAVQKTIAESPELSDRATAKVVGCSPQTVAKIRASTAAQSEGDNRSHEPAAPPVVLDALGVPVPEAVQAALKPCAVRAELLSALHRAQELVKVLAELPSGELLKQGRKLRCRQEHGGATKTYTSDDIWNAISLFNHTSPYVGCPYCFANGKRCTKDGCRSLGWITEGAWKDVPAETKKAYQAQAVTS
jgi:hypothetical protein